MQCSSTYISLATRVDCVQGNESYHGASPSQRMRDTLQWSQARATLLRFAIMIFNSGRGNGGLGVWGRRGFVYESLMPLSGDWVFWGVKKIPCMDPSPLGEERVLVRKSWPRSQSAGKEGRNVGSKPRPASCDPNCFWLGPTRCRLDCHFTHEMTR